MSRRRQGEWGVAITCGVVVSLFFVGFVGFVGFVMIVAGLMGALG